MLFNLEFDIGEIIEGYLVPDGFSEQPGIRVLDGRDEIAELDCDQKREAVITSGRHANGMVGFRLTDALIPQLAGRTHITIVDRKTGMLVYRRPQQQHIVHKHIFRLETRIIPFQKFDRALDSYFQYAINGVERFGHETAMQAFHLNAISSIYISGRMLVRNYEEFLEKGFHFVTILNDPYEDMAERIFLFHRFAHVPTRALGERDRMIIAPAIEHFDGVDLTSTKALRRALRSANEQVQRVLLSPLTRQLVATYPEQGVSRHSLAAAMDMLSRFEVIGMRDYPDTFIYPLSELFEVPFDVIPEPTSHSAVLTLADRLRQLPDAELLLELDLILYHFARDKIVSSATGGEVDQPLS